MIDEMRDTRRLVQTLVCATALATACASPEADRNDGGGRPGSGGDGGASGSGVAMLKVASSP